MEATQKLAEFFTELSKAHQATSSEEAVTAIKIRLLQLDDIPVTFGRSRTKGEKEEKRMLTKLSTQLQAISTWKESTGWRALITEKATTYHPEWGLLTEALSSVSEKIKSLSADIAKLPKDSIRRGALQGRLELLNDLKAKLDLCHANNGNYLDKPWTEFLAEAQRQNLEDQRPF